MRRFLFLLLLAFHPLLLSGVPFSCGSSLLDDLMVVEYWNRVENERFPVTYNHLFYGGYFNMPSARMAGDGLIGVGFSYVPPYHNYNLYCQLTPFFEVSGNYRVFRGVADPILTPLGFGDMSDKGANCKLAIFKPEDSDYELPGLAIGVEDFLGTRNFKAKYAVLTHVFLKHNLEVSLGIGAQRIRRWFGGVLWMPFRTSGYKWLAPLSLALEYDATPYKSEKIEKHPKGRSQKTKINGGVKYRLWNQIDFSLSYVRGEELAASFDMFYDLGHTKGFVPKIDDPLPLRPSCRPSLEISACDQELIDLIVEGFDDQGIQVLKIAYAFDCKGKKSLKIKIYNEYYRLESCLRDRLNGILAGVIPAGIERVVVVIDAEGFPIQEYHYEMACVRDFEERRMGGYELKTLSPLEEVDFSTYDVPIYQGRRELFNRIVLPKTHTFFGSAKGKFKYSLGINVGGDGFLPKDIYYSVLIGYNFLSNIYSLKTADRLNPSQLIQVRSDIVKYYQQKGITLDEAYVQKCWNMGHAWYSKVAFGYFEEEYAGLAGQILYYPLKSSWAFGFEGALFKKRSYKGWGFTSKVRKLKGFVPFWKDFPVGSQAFFDVYYDWKEAYLDFKMQIGKFLANDVGVRYEISRYFPSGLRISAWYTYTNGHDKINGSTYHDKGVAFSMPLDVFYTESSRKRWGYGMSAWLRDVGVIAATGQDLYELINDQRQ